MPITAGGSYAGAEEAMVDQWIHDRLRAHAAFDAISPGLTSRIFSRFAAPGTRYPFIVYQAATPIRDVRGVGVFRVMVDTLYIVKAVAQSETYVPLVPVVREIDAVMTVPDVAPVADGIVLVSMREEQFSLIEVESGKQYRHFGGQYRIQAQAHQ